MTLAATSIIEINSAATAGNLNGGGFNPSNAGMLTNLAATVANTSAPIVTSASYNFVAGDVGNWLYIQAGTNWTVGWYKIISVAANAATLEAAVGSANVRLVTNNQFGANTVIGCATVASPTGGTFTIDYSQSTACITATALSNYASVGASTNLTSASAPFTPVMVGNFLCISGKGTGNFGVLGWYEIVSFTNTSTVVTDRTTNSGTAMVAGVGKIGGALSLGGAATSLDDNNVFSTLVVSSATATTRYFIKGSATYTLGVAVTQTNGNASWPVVLEGYATSRGDRPVGSTRPVFACGANAFTRGGRDFMFSIQFTGTGTTVLAGASSSDGLVVGCKSTNSSTTAARSAFSGGGKVVGCEGVSYRGIAFLLPDNTTVSTAYLYNYAHDSNIGFLTSTTSGAASFISGNIIEGCVTAAIDTTGATNNNITFTNNTLYGAENKLGIGLNLITLVNKLIAVNNIFYGLATGIAHADVETSNYGNYNDFFNNTADINTANHWQKGLSDTAVNPGFSSVAQITGTTATTTAGNHLVQAGATFVTSGVTAGRDYLYIKSGTGASIVGIYGILSVDSETQITTDITLTADATADKTWQITTGHNFKIGANLQGTGYPGAFPAGLSTGVMDVGAVQSDAATASGSFLRRK